MKKNYILFFLFLFLYSRISFAVDNDERTVIISDKINKEKKDVIKAIGDVEIKKGDRIFNADEVEYNQTTRVIKANSDVRVFDAKQSNIFFSERAKVLDDFTSGEFYNGIIIFKNGSSISSSNIRKANDSDLFMRKTLYSVCPTDNFDENLTYEDLMRKLDNEKTPLFSLKSTRIDANTEDKQMSLWGTSVWLWKIPIFYLPYFKSGLVFNQNINGFGIPGIESTNHYGYGVYIPYNLFGRKQQFTLTPKIYQKGNYLLNVKYKGASKNSNNWAFSFKADAANDRGQSKDLVNAYGLTEEAEGKYKDFRGYADIVGYYNFNDLWSFDYNATIVSDRYYLRDYYRSGLSYTQSNLNFTNVNMRDMYNFNYLQFSNLFYQELLEKDINYIEPDKDTNYNAPRYAPVLNLHWQDFLFKNNNSNIFYSTKVNTTSLFRNNGLQYNRFTITPEISGTFKTKFGIVNTSANVRGDIYILNQLGEYRGIYDDNTGRLLPQFNIEWRKVFSTTNFTFQPIVKYSVSAKDSGFERKIPNEDSKPQTLSFENIFSNNRFIGYDRQESGNRITYGFESILFNNLGIGLAQGYRDNIDEENQRLVGFDGHMSDYTGYISYVFNNNLDIYYRFLIDKDNFYFKKNEVNLNLDTGFIDMYLIYTNLDADLFKGERQNQINSGVLFTLFRRWKFDISGIIDIENNNRIAQSDFGLIYDGNCVIWKIYYTRYNPSSETDKNTSINFSFTIKFF